MQLNKHALCACMLIQLAGIWSHALGGEGSALKCIHYNSWPHALQGYGTRSVCPSLCLSVCLSVCYHEILSAAYLVCTSKTKFYRVVYGVFKVFVVWISLKTLPSKVLATSAGHRCLPHSLASFRWTKEYSNGFFSRLVVYV